MREFIKNEQAEKYLNGKLWIASQGGVASEYIRMYVFGIYEDARVNPYTGRPMRGAVAHMGEPVPTGPTHCIYTYGDVMNSVLSQIRRHPDNAGKFINDQSYEIRTVKELEGKEDAFNVTKQIESFSTKKVDYPIAMLNYDWMTQSTFDYIGRVFNISIESPFVWRERKQYVQDLAPNEQKVMLNAYGEIDDYVKSLPSVIIRYPEDNRTLTQNDVVESRVLIDLDPRPPKRVKHKAFIQDHTVYDQRDFWFDPPSSKLIINEQEAVLPDAIYNTEDLRVFEWQCEPYIITNARNAVGHRGMYIYNINTNKMVRLTHPDIDPSVIQKNWVPFVLNGELYFVYSFLPTLTILKLTDDAGRCELVTGEIVPQHNMRLKYGSTPLIPWSYPYYIGFLHSRMPWFTHPVMIDTKNMKTHYVGNRIIFDKPEEAKWDNRRKGIIQFAYDLKVEKDATVKLYVDFQDHCPTELNINYESFCKQFSH